MSGLGVRGSVGDASGSRRRGTDPELRAWLELAQACCDEADSIALEHFRRDVAVKTKPDRTLVTEADRAIEVRIREAIARRFPEHGVIGEELGEDGQDRPIRWYVDPIDGTHNFVRGIPLFGTLIGCERDGEMQVGVMSAPALGDRWFAWRGGGAWATGRAHRDDSRPRRLRVSDVSELADGQILYGSLSDIERSGRAPGIRTVLAAAWRERGFGDFWGYALVAEGAAEGMIEIGLNSWDLAAAVVVVEEAGGRITDLEGRRSIHRGEVLASNGVLHDALLDALREAT